MIGLEVLFLIFKLTFPFSLVKFRIVDIKNYSLLICNSCQVLHPFLDLFQLHLLCLIVPMWKIIGALETEHDRLLDSLIVDPLGQIDQFGMEWVALERNISFWAEPINYEFPYQTRFYS